MSSTSKDLGDFRQAAAVAIKERGMSPIMMEGFPAVSRDAVEVCKTEVEEADLFIGIYANRYGYCPNSGNKSITELEYEWAEQAGIDRLIFVLDKTSKFPAKHAIRAHADDDPRMHTFLARIGQQIVWKEFKNPDDLKHQVSRSIEDWQKVPPENASPEMPSWAGLLSLLLLLLTVGGLAYYLLLLFRAGQESMGLVSGGLGLFGMVLSVGTFYWKNAHQFWGQFGNIKSWWVMLLTQLLVILSVFVISPMILDIAAEDLLEQGLATSNYNEAHTLLKNADLLGADIPSAVDNKLQNTLNSAILPDSIEQAMTLARLLVEFAPDNLRQNRVDQVTDGVKNLAQNPVAGESQLPTSYYWMQVLTILDAEQAKILAANFYNQAIDAYAKPELSLALNYLNAFLGLEVGLDRQKLSYAYYLQGIILDASDQKAAWEAYQQALRMDDANLEARYALASGLFVSAENNADPEILNEVIELARRGWEDYIPDEFCRGSHDLTIPAEFQPTWYCFLLMTTEGGARILRKGKEDSLNTIRGVLERAIKLAEANNQFGENYYTAEAYYWLARATEPDSEEGLAVYCAIIKNHDSTKPRHRQWVAFANEKLDGFFCF